jgi:hypothetical protein
MPQEAREVLVDAARTAEVSPEITAEVDVREHEQALAGRPTLRVRGVGLALDAAAHGVYVHEFLKCEAAKQSSHPLGRLSSFILTGLT